ncbi:MAG: GTP-binding protein, partial [Acetobacter malorum]
FDHDKAEQHPLWYKELYGAAEHVPETEEYGISSFVYRARRPFIPEKFKAFIDTSWPGVVRAKGHFWLATRPEWVGELGQAGALVRTQAMGLWWCVIPTQHWPEDDDWKAMLVGKWDPVYGDRRQEIVFIGTPEMDEAALRAALDACLAPQDTDRFQPELYANLPDPFPAWRHRQPEEEDAYA